MWRLDEDSYHSLRLSSVWTSIEVDRMGWTMLCGFPDRIEFDQKYLHCPTDVMEAKFGDER